MKKGALVIGLVSTAILLAVVAGLYYFGRQKMIRDSISRFSAAKSLYEESRWPEARALFEEISKEYSRSDLALESIYYLAAISQTEGKYEEALELWNSRPRIEGDARAVEVDYNIAFCLEKLGRKDQAAEGYEKVVSTRPEGNFTCLATVGLGRIAEEGGDHEKAHEYYEQAVEHAGASAEARDLAEKLLGDLNLRMFYTPREGEYLKAYLISRGDSMVSIAIRNDVTVDQLCRLNDISNPTRIRPNQRILIPDTDFSIHIDKSEFKLTLSNHGRFFKSYKVGLGKHGATPVGEYVISDKIKNPTWWSPSGPVPPGDPNNELGTRWMAMKPLTPGIGPDYGIHGTVDPSTIGWESSNGCPRMYPADAEEFYMLIPKGTPVVVGP